MTISAVAYARVSTAEQSQGYSLDVQSAELRRYCKHHGWKLKRLFVEPGSSAKTSKRPVFQEMLDYCRKNRDAIDVVLVHKLDRFMRDTYHHHQIRALLAGYGIAVRSATEPIGDDPSGMLLEGMLSAIAKFDNDVRSDRTVSGMKAAVARGRWCWKPPRGYVRGTVRSMEHDPTLGPIIRQLFIDCATGWHAVGDLVKRANAQGLDVHAQVLSRMLRNPLYMGIVRVDKWDIETKGDFEPLVDEATFLRAQAALDGRMRSNGPQEVNREEFPLKGLVRCECGVPLTASWARGKKRRYAYYHSQPRCKGCRVNVPTGVLEASFLDLLRRVQPMPELVTAFHEMVLNVWNERKDEVATEQKRLTWRLKEISKKKSQLVDAHVHQRTIDADTYRAHMDELREQEALAKLERYDAELEDLDVEAVLGFATETLSDLAASWNTANLKQKQRLQSMIFPHPVIWDGEGVRTLGTASVFGLVDPVSDEKELLVTPARFELALPA